MSIFDKYLVNSFLKSETTTDAVPTAFYSEDFATTLGDFTTSGDVVWTRVIDEGNGDLFSARSGAITHNEQSILQLVKTTTQFSTLLRYDYKTSTEADFDYLHVKVNGVIVARHSGTNAWTTNDVYIHGIGSQTIQFIYYRDTSDGGGTNQVWVDNVGLYNYSESAVSNTATLFKEQVVFNDNLISKGFASFNGIQTNFDIEGFNNGGNRLFRQTVRDSGTVSSQYSTDYIGETLSLGTLTNDTFVSVRNPIDITEKVKMGVQFVGDLSDGFIQTHAGSFIRFGETAGSDLTKILVVNGDSIFRGDVNLTGKVTATGDVISNGGVVLAASYLRNGAVVVDNVQSAADLNQSFTGAFYSNGGTNQPPSANSFIQSQGIAGGLYTQQIGGRNGNLYFRHEEAGTWGSWQKILSDDASSVDAKYLRSDVADTKTVGDLSISENVFLRFGATHATLGSTGSQFQLNLVNQDYRILDNSSTRFTFGRTTGAFTSTGVIHADTGDIIPIKATNGDGSVQLGSLSSYTDSPNYIQSRNAADSAYINFGIKTAAGNPNFVFDTSGNLGIGTTTPDNELDVNGTGKFTTSVIVDAGATNTTQTINDVVGYEISGENTGGGWGRGIVNTLSGIRKAGIGFLGVAGGALTHINLAVDANWWNASAGLNIKATALAWKTDEFYIDSAGNVGINTSSPDTKLDVADTYPIIRLTDTRQLGSGAYDGVYTAGIEFYTEDASGIGAHIGASIRSFSDTGASTTPAHNLTFSTSLSSAVESEAMRITSNGNVSIGNTNDTYKLDVSGTGRFTSTVTATNFILSSDERLKENIENFDYGQHIEINVKTYELKSEPGVKRTGVIAQEIEKNHPEFVRTDDEGIKSVTYIDLLMAKIAELEARLEKAGI